MLHFFIPGNPNNNLPLNKFDKFLIACSFRVAAKTIKDQKSKSKNGRKMAKLLQQDKLKEKNLRINLTLWVLQGLRQTDPKQSSGKTVSDVHDNIITSNKCHSLFNES